MMRKSTKLGVPCAMVAMVMLGALGGCGDPGADGDAAVEQSELAPYGSNGITGIAVATAGGARAAAALDGDVPPAEPAPDATPWPADRKIIRDIRLELEVEDVEAVRSAAARIATDAGGFLSDIAVSMSDAGHHRGQLSVRVPADRVEAVVVALSELGEVHSETVTSQDVTRQYRDTETRLRVLRETDARLRQILAHRTGDLADVLQVERELSRVVTQIERLEGQRRYWDERVALSTIHVSLFEPATIVEPGWFDPVVEAFRDSLGVLSRSTAVLITLAAGALPFVLLGTLAWLGWVARRSFVRRREPMGHRAGT